MSYDRFAFWYLCKKIVLSRLIRRRKFTTLVIFFSLLYVHLSVIQALRSFCLSRPPLVNATSKRANLVSTETDMVNEYHPFVDFKFVFPVISPEVKKTPEIFMMVLVNSCARGNKYRNLRKVIRQTWGNQSNCEQRKAMENEGLKDLRWLLVFVVGKAGPGTNDDELNIAEARQHNDMLIGNITDKYS